MRPADGPGVERGGEEMSYDCSMVVDDGDEYPSEVCDIGNYTSNVSMMWYLALGGIGLDALHGKTGLELIPVLEKAVSHILHPANKAIYQQHVPSNGWGSHEGAAKYLESILAACRKYPKAMLDVDC